MSASSSNDIDSLRRSGDARLALLEDWLASIFGDRDFEVTVASADASFRRYFRVSRRDETLIAMDAPPDKEDIEPYVRIAAILVELGVNAPRVLYRDFAQGFLLNSDLGSKTYLSALEDRTRADRLYGDAIDALVRIQSHGEPPARTLPPYDAGVLQREMALFPEWFCGKHLGLELTDSERSMLARSFDTLIEEALQQPRVFVHRDFHSRNLMVCEGARQGANPGILDFQDALQGPITYDLVSLLRDCYIEWPPERVRTWLEAFRDRAAHAGLYVGDDLPHFERWFDLMGIQRHLKVLGIFARLFHRDGKAGYLKELPLTLAYVRRAIGRHTDLGALQSFLEDRIVPRFEGVRAGTRTPR